jgi:hypothetical protein
MPCLPGPFGIQSPPALHFDHTVQGACWVAAHTVLTEAISFLRLKNACLTVTGIEPDPTTGALQVDRVLEWLRRPWMENRKKVVFYQFHRIMVLYHFCLPTTRYTIYCNMQNMGPNSLERLTLLRSASLCDLSRRVATEIQAIWNDATLGPKLKRVDEEVRVSLFGT